MSKYRDLQVFLTGNKFILILFCALLNVRILTELPRVISETGVAHNNISNYDLNRAVSFLIIFFCLFWLLSKRRIKVSPILLKIGFFVIIFLLASTVVGIHTFLKLNMPVTGVFVVIFRFILEIVLVIFIINFISTQSDVGVLFSFFLKPTLFFISVISLLQILSSSYADIQGVYRLTGPFGSPGTFGGFLHLTIVLTFYYYGNNHSLNFWFLLVLQYYMLLMTGSIGSILANLIFLALVAFKQHWFRLKIFYLLFPILIVVILVGVAYKWESIESRLAILINLDDFELADGSSIKWRIEAWQHYINLLGDNIFNWMFGLGIGTHRWIFHPDYLNSLDYIFQAPGTHNDYLGVLIDFGLLGVIFFMSGLSRMSSTILRYEQVDAKLCFLRFYFYSSLFVMVSENYIDQLVAFIFIIFLTSIIKAAPLERRVFQSLKT
jgi:O-Antigen ligase